MNEWNVTTRTTTHGNKFTATPESDRKRINSVLNESADRSVTSSEHESDHTAVRSTLVRTISLKRDTMRGTTIKVSAVVEPLYSD